MSEASGFAELIAALAVSFSRAQRAGQPSDLVEQIVAGAVLMIPGVQAAAVLTLTSAGLLTAPVARGDEVARAVMDAQNEAGQGRVWTLGAQTSSWWRMWLLTSGGSLSPIGCPAWGGVDAVHADHGGRVRAGVLSLIGGGIDFDDVEQNTAALARVFAAHAGVAMTGQQQSKIPLPRCRPGM